MTKLMTPVFAAIVLVSTYYGAVAHNSAVSFILDTGSGASLIRASLVVIICLYFLAGTLRRPATKYLMTAIGLGLLYVGIAGLLTAQLSDMFNYFMLPVDVFFAIEGGVIALLLSLDLPLDSTVQAPKRKTTRDRTKKIPAMST